DFCRPIRRPGRGQEKLPKASHQFFLRLRLARLYVNTSFNQVRAVPPCLVSCEPNFVATFVSEPKTVSSEGGIFIPQQGLHQRNVPWNQPRSNYNQPNFMCVEVSDNGRCKLSSLALVSSYSCRPKPRKNSRLGVITSVVFMGIISSTFPVLIYAFSFRINSVYTPYWKVYCRDILWKDKHTIIPEKNVYIYGDKREIVCL
ncbi:hypothetical protein J6590_106386, partial [Homalodisca vitripennis]